MYYAYPGGNIVSNRPTCSTCRHFITTQEMHEQFVGRDLEVAVVEVDAQKKKLVGSVVVAKQNNALRKIKVCWCRTMHSSPSCRVLCITPSWRVLCITPSWRVLQQRMQCRACISHPCTGWCLGRGHGAACGGVWCFRRPGGDAHKWLDPHFQR